MKIHSSFQPFVFVAFLAIAIFVSSLWMFDSKIPQTQSAPQAYES